MPDNEEFYLGPIPAGYYSLTDLVQGLIHIEHIMEANVAMAYEAENRRRVQEAQRPNG